MMSGMTGGRAVRMAAKGDLAFASLSDGLAGYYRLGVRALPEDLDGKPHKISVKVLRPGAKLAGNRRILAATVSPTAKALASGDAQTALRAALESPTPVLDVDVRATSYVLHGEAGSRDVRIVVVGDVGRAVAGKATAVAALYDSRGAPGQRDGERGRRAGERVGRRVDRNPRAAGALRAAPRRARRRGARRQPRAPDRRALEIARRRRDARPGAVPAQRSAPAPRRVWCSGR